MLKWPILEWDLFHPLREELTKVGCFNPTRISFGPRTANTLVTIQELGQRLQSGIAGASMNNPKRGPASFIWLAVEVEIDPEDKDVSHETCGRVARDPLLMQVVTDAVQAPVRKACQNIAMAILRLEQTFPKTPLKFGVDPKQLPEITALVNLMKMELTNALTAARINILNSQSSVPPSATTKGEVLRGGRIAFNLGLGVVGVGLAISGIGLPAASVCFFFSAYGLYRGMADLTKSVVSNFETAKRVRTRLWSAFDQYRGGVVQHGKKAFAQMLSHSILKTGVLYNLTQSGKFASLTDIDDDIEEYEGLIKTMRSQLGQLSEQLCDKMDTIKALESKHSLVTKTIAFEQMLPSGEVRRININSSKQEQALEKLLVKIESAYPKWDSDLRYLAPLKNAAKDILAGGDGVIKAEKVLDCIINAATTVGGALTNPPDPKKGEDIAALVLDVVGQFEPAAALIGGNPPDRFQGSAQGGLRPLT